jgi:shikimate dehydrogenase
MGGAEVYRLLLEPSMFVGDVIAGHGVTPLVQAARDRGCRTSDGVAMVEAAQQTMLDFFLER